MSDKPTTTNFQQLVDRGIELPPPDRIPDADIRTKLWEVLHGLSELRVYLDETDHLSDRELYAQLWHATLREDVPAIDEIGFNNHLQLLSTGGEPWLKNFPDYDMPAHDDPPYNRDCLLPRPRYAQGPEALAWLRNRPE